MGMMKSSKVSLFIIITTLLFAQTLTWAISVQNPNELPPSFSGRPNRLLASRMTCNKYPRVCRIPGSPGPDCCSKKCVNVLTDRQNCGKCGKKCKYSEICCGGSCVNPRSNKQHCGKCNNPCKKGNTCSYGFCNYV